MVHKVLDRRTGQLDSGTVGFGFATVYGLDTRTLDSSWVRHWTLDLYGTVRIVQLSQGGIRISDVFHRLGSSMV